LLLAVVEVDAEVLVVVPVVLDPQYQTLVVVEV
jgi:hypothetical protein